jgi:glycosyltransferase involved in cell wall biosynthesis
MRILHVITSLDARHGGPTAALAGLAVAQAQTGSNVTILATWRGGEDPASVEEDLREVGISVVSCGPGAGPLVRHRALAPAMEKAVEAADVVHIHSLWEEAPHQAAKMARRRGVPYVIEPNGMLTPWSLGQRRWRKRFSLAWRVRDDLNGAAGLHYSSQWERDACAGLQLRAKPIVEPIGLTIDEFTSAPPRGSFRARYPQIGQRPMIAFLGRIHPGKGLEYLLPALAHMRVDRGSDSILVVAGPDFQGYGAMVAARAVQLGIRERLIFVGSLSCPDRIAMLGDADLFCLPSDHENFGLVVIEALAAGTQVIISPHVGIRREVEALGGAVVAQDPATLGAALQRWLDDEPARRALMEKARPFVLEHYDWTKIAERWAEHYRRLAGG